MTLEELLIRNMAPTLAGIKVASLVCLKGLSEGERLCVESLCRKGLSFFLIENTSRCPLLYVYRKEELKRILSDKDVISVLSSFGYSIGSVSSVLLHLRRRFLESEFPHEVGLFLGYPVADVIGFINNSGQNYLMSGFWKVYKDAERASEIFRKYRICNRVIGSCYEKGMSIERLCITA